MLSFRLANIAADANHAARVAQLTNSFQSAIQAARDAYVSYPADHATFSRALAAAEQAKSAGIAASVRQRQIDIGGLQLALDELGPSAAAAGAATVFVQLATAMGVDPSVAGAVVEV